MKILLKGLLVIGVFLFIGTAGASDLSNISFSQILLQIFIAVAFIMLGHFGLEFIKERQKCIRKAKVKLPQAA
jgi:hypothetical protein